MRFTSSSCAGRTPTRRRTTRPLILFLVLVGAGTVLRGQDPGAARSYDFRMLERLGATFDRNLPIETPPLRPGAAGEASMRYLWTEQRESTVRFGDGEISPLLRAAAGVAPNADPGQVMEGGGARFTFRGSVERQQQFASSIAQLVEAIAAEAIVDIFEIPAAATVNIDKNVLDPKQVSDLLAAVKPTRSQRVRAQFGVQAAIDSVTRKAYVKDYDVEVAQSSSAGDPLIDVLLSGFRGTVRVEPTIDGRLAITIRASDQHEVAAMKSHVVKFPTEGTIQLPTVAWSCAGASALVVNEGGVLFGNNVNDRGLWLARVRRAAQPKPLAIEGAELLPVGPLVLPVLTQAARSHVGVVNASGNSDPAAEASAEDLFHYDRQWIADNLFGSTVGDHDVTMVGTSLAVVANDAQRKSAREMITRLTRDVARTVSLEVRAGVLDASAAPDPAVDDSSVAAALPLRLRTCARTRDSVLMVAATCEAYMKDEDVEIAEKATIADPNVDVLQTGLSCSATVTTAGENRWVVEWTLRYSEHAGKMGSVLTTHDDTGPIDLPELRGVSLGGQSLPEAGTWVEVCRTTVAGTDKVFLAFIRLAE